MKAEDMKCKNCLTKEALPEGLCSSCEKICRDRLAKVERELVASRKITRSQRDLLENLAKVLSPSRLAESRDRLVQDLGKDKHREKILKAVEDCYGLKDVGKGACRDTVVEDTVQTAPSDEAGTVVRAQDEADTVTGPRMPPPARREKSSFVSLDHLGDYRILDLLGKGGFGVVYLAEDPKLERKVAIKVLADHLAIQPGYVERFEREAKSAARLKHPNVISIYEAEEVEGVHYLAMEFVEGRTVQEILQAGPMDEKQILNIAVEVAKGLAHAHTQGIIHRDLKPGNIMVDQTGRVVIMDFGLARPEQAGGTLTESDMIVGTPVYMSPEQAQVSLGNVDRRSDIYSLGVVLYQLLTGKVPFTGQTPVAILKNVIDTEPDPPRKVRKGIGRDLEAIVLKAMEKDREKRYQTAQELQEDIERYLAGKSVKAKKRTWIGQGMKWTRRNARSLAAAGLAAGLATGLFWVWSSQRIERQKKESQALVQKSQQEMEATQSKLTEYQDDQTAEWSEQPSFEDDFQRPELGSEWEVDGDGKGWKIEDGALTYFGYEGGVAWIKDPVVGDFRLEVDVELPGWTEERLEEAVELDLIRQKLPLPPPGTRLAPKQDSWNTLVNIKSKGGEFSGVQAGKNVYVLASYLEADLKDQPDRTLRVHAGGAGARWPSDRNAFAIGTITALVESNREPWKTEGSVLCEGSAFRSDLGKYRMIVTREGDVLTARVGEEIILKTQISAEPKISLGLAALGTTEYQWPAVGEKGPQEAKVLSWLRYEGVRLYTKALARKVDPLELARSYLTQGNLELAENTYRAALQMGLPKDMTAKAHAGLAEVLLGVKKTREAREELQKALPGLDAPSKCEIARVFWKADPKLGIDDFFSKEDVPEAWKTFVVLQEDNAVRDLIQRMDESHVEKLKEFLKGGDPRVRSGALALLGRMKAQVEVSQLASLMAEEDDTVRGQAIDYLSAYGLLQNRDVVAKCIEMLRSSNGNVRVDACGLLLNEAGKTLTEKDIQKIMTLAKDGSQGTRETAALILGNTSSSEAAALLRKLLRDKDPAMRRSAIAALCTMRDQEAIPGLKKCLEDSDPECRKMALSGLSKAFPEAMEKAVIPKEASGESMAFNESSAIGAMRTISSANETFRSAIVKDQDKDGLGEYATLEEMAGLSPPKGSNALVNPPFIDLMLGRGGKDGYLFEVVVGAQACDGVSGVNGEEVSYFAVAWPQSYGVTGKRSFCIDASGVLRGADIGGKKPTCEALKTLSTVNESGPSSSLTMSLPQRSAPSGLPSNESSAIAGLRTISSANETFRAALIKDQDKDSKGEYGTLEEMAGLVSPKGAKSPVDPPFIDNMLGKGTKDGYLFEIVVGAQACGGASGVDGEETRYFAVAWPRQYGITGNRSFCIDQTGVIRQKDTLGTKPTCEAVVSKTPWPTVGG